MLQCYGPARVRARPTADFAAAGRPRFTACCIASLRPVWSPASSVRMRRDQRGAERPLAVPIVERGNCRSPRWTATSWSRVSAQCMPTLKRDTGSAQRDRRRGVLPEWQAPAAPARFRHTPHSKPVGLWLRSARRGLRGLRSPFPSMTQTTHPCGPRRPAYTFLLRARHSAVLVSAFIVLPFHGFENPARRPLRDDGARAPRPGTALVTDGCL